MEERSGQQLDNYRLMRLLGRGTFGEVYLGEHIYRKNLVAVKVLRMRLSDNAFYDFINEARIFRLQHPNIVAVLDFGVERASGTPFIVMSYAANGTLRQRHPRGTQVPLPTIVEYVKQIASALQYSHEENLIHRDVKPENMLIDANDRVLLSDFGIATVSQSMHSLQYMGDLAGTPSYMSAEQFLGKPSRASDQYALGTIVYEWFSGTCPFVGTFYELFGQHTQAPPPPLPRTLPFYSPEVERVIMRALEKNPDARFASVSEFALALDDACKQVLDAGQAPTLYIKSKEEYVREGNLLYDQQRYTDAITTYSFAIVLDSTDSLIHTSRGLAYRMLQDYQSAIADYNRALELAPNNAFAYNNRGYVYFLLQRYQEAIMDYDRALALEPNYAQAYNNRGNAYSLLGAFDRALLDYERAISLEPSYATAYYNRGNAYDELGRYREALADFNSAIALNSEYIKAYNNRAYVYRELKDYQSALADYNNILALDPAYVGAYSGRGQVYSELGELQKALADYDRALELDPGAKSALINKSELLRKLQKTREPQ